MKKSIKYLSALTMLICSASGNALEINNSSIIDGVTKVSNRPNLVFVFTNDIKNSAFILKDENNKIIRLRKTQKNNTVSLMPRRGLKESQKYTLSIQAEDSSEALTQTISFTVGKGDRKAPEITSVSNIDINDNEIDVLRISANDENKIIYALMKSRDGSKFNLDSNSGALTLKNKANYEKKRKYATKISATDSKGNYSLQNIAIRVKASSDAPVFTSASNINVSEHQKSVVVLKATGKRVRYSLSGKDALSFNLNSKNGRLKFKASPKLSEKSSYSIVITATDRYKNSSTQEITISITRDGGGSLPDTKAPVFTSASNIPVNENQTSVITVKATDENKVIYSLSGTDYSSFTLDSKSGRLSFKIAPDYETKTSYLIKVSAKDTAGNSATQNIKVTIKDIDEQEENDTSLVGGIFTDSDGTTPKMDDFITFTAPADMSKVYTQSEYRQLLSQPVLIAGNLHSFAGKHYRNDLIDPNKQWPEAAHLLLRYIQSNGRNSLLVGYDGVSGEGMNYDYLWLGGLEGLASSLFGYQDPENWTPPVGVKKITEPLTLDDIMPPSERWNSLVTNPLMLTLPDATDSGPHDSGLQYHDSSNPRSASAWGAGGYHFGYSIDKTAKSYLLPAFGQLGLGAGKLNEPNLQVQSILHFSPKPGNNGHTHNDTLMLGLFGQGRNLLSFPGHKKQTHGPHNKNMVMVNGDWQNKYVSDIAGRLEIFASMPGIQIARVDASHIMHGGNANGTRGKYIDRYRRTYIQNTIDIEKSYLLDVFEVKGGSEHDFLMRGSVVLEQTYPTTNLPLGNGTMPISDTAQVQFVNTKKATYGTNKSFWVDINFKDKPNLGSRSHFPAQEAGELYLNEMLETRFTPVSYPAAQYTLHRSGAAPLESTFVAVHEVLDGSGSSFIESVTKESLDSDSIAVTVTLKNGRIDTYLVSFDGKKTMSYNGTSAEAIIAASSSFNDKSDLWMVGGSSISNDSRDLYALNTEVSANVSRVNRKEDGATSNSFDTDMTLALGYQLANQTILLENFEDEKLKYTNSYTIKFIEEIDNKIRIHVNFDPGVIITSSSVKEIHSPRREATSAKLRFVPSDTTVPRIVNVFPGKDPAQRLNPQVGRPLDVNEDVELTTIPAYSQVVYKLNGSSYENIMTGSSIALTDDSDVIMRARNDDGFVQSQEIEERYYKPQPAVLGTAGASGLIATRYTGWTYNLDLNDPLNSYDFRRMAPSAIVKGLSFAQVPYQQVAAGSGVVVEGYIKVPTTGLYKFFTRMDRAVELKIDDRAIVYEQGMRAAAQWMGEMYLEEGLHKIDVHHYTRVNAHFSVTWEGPGIPYGEIPEDIFFQDIQ